MILAGDIGGTNTRLAVFEEDGKTLARQHVFKNKGRGRFEDVVTEFVGQGGNEKIKRACFGVAGAVRGGVVRMTNLGWTLDEREIARTLNVPKVALINDMVAHGENIDNLRDEQVETLRAGEPVPDGNGAVIIAGTGLGEGGLYYDRATNRHRGMASEGGHCDFAPADGRQDALLRFLRKNQKPTSFEAVVSGPGLRTIYDFLRETEPELAGEADDAFGADGPKPEQITAAGEKGQSRLAAETLTLFVSIYGAEAGNLALKCCATAGVWLGGSIAEDIAREFCSPAFLAPFSAKGPDRIREMLSKVPIYLIKFELNGLYGAASYAAGL